MSLANKQARAALQGDFDAMGDPGIFGFVGGVVKKAVNVGIDILPGPIGGIARAGRSALRGAPTGVGSRVGPLPTPRRSRPGVGSVRVAIPSFRTPFGGVVRGRGTTGRAPSADIEFGFGGGGLPLNGGAPVGLVEGSVGQPVPACPQGMRPNKSSYFRRSPAGGVVFIRKGTVCVSSRRRNALNPRALDRAIGRVVSAKKAAKKLGTITVRKTCP